MSLGLRIRKTLIRSVKRLLLLRHSQSRSQDCHYQPREVNMIIMMYLRTGQALAVTHSCKINIEGGSHGRAEAFSSSRFSLVVLTCSI